MTRLAAFTLAVATAATSGAHFLAAQTPATPAQTEGCSDPRFQPALETIRTIVTEQRLPSVAIAVGERGRSICEAAFGWADVERRIAATPSTMYSLASISKPFTATAIMRMVQERAIDPQRPANDYLGTAKLRAFEGRVADATVHRLLTHTAGLPLHYQFFYEGGPAVPSMDDAIGQYGVIVYPPGERYFYANFGYGVLERILERTAGSSYTEILSDTVLKPLALSHTMVSDGAKIDGHTAALRYGTDGKAIAAYTFDHVGASGVWSSARDLLRFGMFHLGHDAPGTKPPLTRAMRRLMQRAHADADGPGRVRGLGWGINENVDGWRQVAHTGSMPGVATILSLYPEADAAIVVLTNVTSSGAVARMERALRSGILPSRSSPTDSGRGGRTGGDTSGGRSDRETDPARPPLPSTLTGRWTGCIYLPEAIVRTDVEVLEDGEVRLRVGDQPQVRLEGVRMSDRWLSARVALQLRGPDAAPEAVRMDNRATITLAHRGERLSGWISMVSPAVPTYGAVSYPMQFAKVASQR